VLALARLSGASIETMPSHLSDIADSRSHATFSFATFDGVKLPSHRNREKECRA